MEDNIVVKKVEGGSIINHSPLFSENGRLVKIHDIHSIFSQRYYVDKYM